ncbi:MAG: carbon starvation protein A [Methanobrevibacter sp.]|uniref:carbon starvation CstA family protein n=1 Tax=Methanobrevibacter sp. TaxID=66852 RepID=UPI0025FC5F17|nr:carbon starvation CstA family protein [Methanobrevibacter sp.]MBR3112235.1 carbon starvation protein A [Methanobrevibacter sp.]MBR6994210.1 carbon starvation protein A [Methanobrevibacter sp.]
MYSFLICAAVLITSYFIYGKFIERIVGVDENNETPAKRLGDGVDYIPLPKYKNFLVHFLNIAGLGPIFGAIQGALFGPAAFLWIVLGTIFIGSVHDFFSGFMSLRNDGLTMPNIISKYLGNTIQKFTAIIIIITGILVAATFATGAADLIANLTNTPVLIWTIIIFIYFLIATLFPIDKIIGRVYPIFGALFLIMAILMTGALLLNPSYTIPEFTTQGLYLTDKTIFPYLFVTIACGAISGFHASQSPIVARCMENEKDARPVFFGAMVLEGLTALCWAAIAMAFFHGQPQLAVLYGSTPSVAVNQMATTLLGPIGLILAVIGVVICPITTGDTSLRSSRITLADELHFNQEKLSSRLKLALPLFIVSFALTFVDFALIWRYFAWAQLIIATCVLFSATVYLIQNKEHYIITLLPAVACSLITFGYILQASEGLRLPSMTANIIAIIATAIITILFLKKFKK